MIARSGTLVEAVAAMTRPMILALGLFCLTGRPVLAADAWGGLPDPTRPPSLGARTTEGGSALQTTLVSPTRKLAIINGRTVGLGDTIGGSVVTDIRSYEVVLKTSSGGVTTLRLMPPLNNAKNDKAP